MTERSTRAATRYRVRHETAYRYRADVVHSHQLLHLVPRPSPYQQCLEHEIVVSPALHRRRNEIDAFGNLVTRVEFDHPHRELQVTSRMEIDIHTRPTVLASDTLPWEKTLADLSYRGNGPPRETLEACRFRHESPYVRIKRLFTEYAADCFPRGRPILACAEALMMKLHRDVRYAPGETTISTPLPDVLRNKRGVCQDFAHLMIACLRSRGLPAQYVSGYVRQTTGGGEDVDEGLIGAGASHAWVSVYAPPHGWVELDPTNDTYVGTDHISVASGRDFGDVSPLRGVILGGGTHSLSVAVTVQRVSRPAPS